MGCIMGSARKHKILLSLNDSEYSLLLLIKTSLQNSSARNISKSDVLRRSLFEISFQSSLSDVLFVLDLPADPAPAKPADRPEVHNVSTAISSTRTECTIVHKPTFSGGAK